MPISRVAFLRALQILGLPPDAKFSEDEIRRQYRQTMKAWHPDVNPEWREETGDYAKEITNARDALLLWLKEGKPAWHSSDKRSPGGETSSSDAERRTRPKSEPFAPPDPAQSPRERVFLLYWLAGLLPHWRVLLVPLGVAVAWWLFGPQRSAPPGTGIGSTAPVSSGVLRQQTATPPTITTVRSADHESTVVKYSTVPYPAFLPDLGPLTDKYPLPLYVSMSKSEVGVVWELIVQKYDRIDDLGFVDAHSDKLRAAMEQDINAIVAQNAMTLECRYYTGKDVGKFGIFRYWYQFRPAEAEPGHLRSLVPNHPLLTVRSARNNCPSTRREADDTQ